MIEPIQQKAKPRTKRQHSDHLENTKVPKLTHQDPTMTSNPSQSATNKVLSIPELLDAILLALPIPTLLAMHLVSTHFHSHILASPALNQHLWLTPNPSITTFPGTTCPRPNPHIWEFMLPLYPKVDVVRFMRSKERPHSNHEHDHKHDDNDDHDHEHDHDHDDDHNHEARQDIWRIRVEMHPDTSVDEETRLGYSWRRMLAVQPVGERTVFDVVVWFKGRRNRYSARGLRFEEGKAVTFGGLQEECLRVGRVDDGTGRLWQE